jgi:hypothetical protein
MATGRAVGSAAAAALLLALPGSAAGPITFSDPAGDSTTAPDVTTVAVSSDPAGNVTFTIAVANRTELAPSDSIFVFIDSDRSAGTGQFGFDYSATLEGAASDLTRWDGTDFRVFPHGAYTAGFSSGSATITLRRADIANPKVFDFGILTFTGDDPETAPYDVAPDDDLWTVPLPAATATLASLGASFAPARPAAGRRFGVRSVAGKLADGSTVTLEAYTCAARLAGKTAPPAGRCSWLIPRGAAGKRLVLTITAAYGGSRRSRSVAFVVR